MNVRDINRRAWDKQVERSNQWTVPVTPDQVARARRGDWSVVLTPETPVPADWFGDLAGRDVLGLASAGGQQCPLFAAAGARVTVYDNSPAQLAQDRAVAEREGLDLTCIEGDMAHLEDLADESFDLVFHPCSNCFVPDVRPVWREAFRVLRPGGALLSGFSNPVLYLFDADALEAGRLELIYSLPYSDARDLAPDRLQARLDNGEPLEFGHTLDDQLGGQLAAGFVLTDLFEDSWDVPWLGPLRGRAPLFMATRAVKPPLPATQR